MLACVVLCMAVKVDEATGRVAVVSAIEVLLVVEELDTEVVEPSDVVDKVVLVLKNWVVVVVVVVVVDRSME